MQIYAKEAGPHQRLAAEIYDELRTNIIENTFKEYQRTGFAWEQYDANNGQGSRSHPFTGVSSHHCRAGVADHACTVDESRNIDHGRAVLEEATPR